MYVQELFDESKIYLILYVDNMLVLGSDRFEIKELTMKELYEAQHILGMRIERDKTKRILHLSQSEYIQKVLRRFNMDKSKLAPTLLPMSIRLSDRESPSTE